MIANRFDGPVELPAGPYQRYATRYEPQRREACLAWWEAPTPGHRHDAGRGVTAGLESSHNFALLLDISHSGASLALDRAPEPNADVWLRLEGETPGDWTEAEVVGVTETTRGPHLVRLAFHTPCSFETLRAAVCG